MTKNQRKSGLDFPVSRPFTVARLPLSRPESFEIRLSEAEATSLADWLSARSVRKFRCTGDINSDGKDGFVVSMQIGVTVTQSCVVTGDPVRTRLDLLIERKFAAAHSQLPREMEIPAEEEDMPDDLGAIIDVGEIVAESILMALPDYPRSEAAGAVAALISDEPGAEDTENLPNPFAGLAALHQKLLRDGEEEPD